MFVLRLAGYVANSWQASWPRAGFLGPDPAIKEEGQSQRYSSQLRLDGGRHWLKGALYCQDTSLASWAPPVVTMLCAHMCHVGVGARYCTEPCTEPLPRVLYRVLYRGLCRVLYRVRQRVLRTLQKNSFPIFKGFLGFGTGFLEPSTKGSAQGS